MIVLKESGAVLMRVVWRGEKALWRLVTWFTCFLVVLGSNVPVGLLEPSCLSAKEVQVLNISS